MTVVLEGEIGRDELPDVGAMLVRLAEKGHVELILDLTHVTHLDYRGIKPLMRKAEALRALGGDLVVAGCSPYVHAIFRSAGAHDAFDFYATALEAQHGLNGLFFELDA
jgi:anti-anti-sigma factor